LYAFGAESNRGWQACSHDAALAALVQMNRCIVEAEFEIWVGFDAAQKREGGLVESLGQRFEEVSQKRLFGANPWRDPYLRLGLRDPWKFLKIGVLLRFQSK
jgi:hypothetical protein